MSGVGVLVEKMVGLNVKWCIKPIQTQWNPSISIKLDTYESWLLNSRVSSFFLDRFNGHHLQTNQLYYGPSRGAIGGIVSLIDPLERP